MLDPPVAAPARGRLVDEHGRKRGVGPRGRRCRVAGVGPGARGHRAQGEEREDAAHDRSFPRYEGIDSIESNTADVGDHQRSEQAGLPPRGTGRHGPRVASSRSPRIGAWRRATGRPGPRSASDRARRDRTTVRGP